MGKFGFELSALDGALRGTAQELLGAQHPELAAAPGFAVDLAFQSEFLAQSIHHGQPDAAAGCVAVAPGLASFERMKDALLVLRRNAVSSVANVEDQGTPARQILPGSAEIDTPAGGRVAYAIHQQVRQDARQPASGRINLPAADGSGGDAQGQVLLARR